MKIERNRILIASLIICIITGSIAFSLKDFSILGKLHLMLIIIICSIVFKMNLFISSLMIMSSFTLYSALFGLVGSLILWTLKTSLLEAIRNPLVIFLVFVPSYILIYFLNDYIRKSQGYVIDLDKHIHISLEDIKREKNYILIIIIIIQYFTYILKNELISKIHRSSQVYVSGYIRNIIFILSLIGVYVLIRSLSDLKLKQSYNPKEVEEVKNNLMSIKHEFNRHLQTIQSMIYLDRVTDVQKYIEEITRYQYDHPLSKIQIKENPALAVLINEKNNLALKKGIDFKVFINCTMEEFPLDWWEINSVIGNLLDNGLEDLEKYKDKRELGFTIDKDNDIFIIEVYNYSSKFDISNLDKLFIPGYSTKNSNSRGYGLYVSQSIIEKYHGTIKVFYDGYVRIKVFIPIK